MKGGNLILITLSIVSIVAYLYLVFKVEKAFWQIIKIVAKVLRYLGLVIGFVFSFMPFIGFVIGLVIFFLFVQSSIFILKISEIEGHLKKQEHPNKG